MAIPGTNIMRMSLDKLLLNLIKIVGMQIYLRFNGNCSWKLVINFLYTMVIGLPQIFKIPSDLLIISKAVNLNNELINIYQFINPY